MVGEGNKIVIADALLDRLPLIVLPPGEKPILSDNTPNAESTTNRDFPAGSLLSGRYKVIRTIGKGGMGHVLEVENVFLKKRLAMKVLKVDTMSPSAVRRFQAEAQVLSNLDHPNLVRAMDFGLLDDLHPYFTMELIEGMTLAQYLEQKGRLDVKEGEAVFAPILSALELAHSKRIIHRDLKPSNIMLVKEGNQLIPKILDFGIAKHDQSTVDAMTRTGEVFGTPLYMSPEQGSGGEITARSDIYSLGCLMFEAFTGAPPFSGRTPLETLMLQNQPNTPNTKEASLGLEFSDVLGVFGCWVLEKRPEDRFQSCQHVLEALREACRSRVTREHGKSNAGINRTSTMSASAEIWRSKKLALPLVILAILTLAVGSVGCFMHLLSHAQEPHQMQINIAKGIETKGQNNAAFEVTSQSARDIQGVSAGIKEKSPEVSESSPTSAVSSRALSSGNLSGQANANSEGTNERAIIHIADSLLEMDSKNRVFNFTADDKDFGRLIWFDHGATHCEASDHKIVVPVSSKLLLHTRQTTDRALAVLGRLRHAHFAGLIFNPPINLLYDPVIAGDVLSQMPDSLELLSLIQVQQLADEAIDKIRTLRNLKFFYYDGGNKPGEVSLDISEQTADKLVKALKLNKMRGFALMRTRRHRLFLQALTDPRKACRLTRLMLWRVTLTTEDCRSIAKLKELTELNVVDSFTHPDSVSELRELAKLPKLRTLHVNCEYLGDRSAKVIATMKLKQLNIRNERPSFAAIRKIIEASGCKVTDQGNEDQGFLPTRDNVLL